MAKILALSDKPLGLRKRPNSRTRKEWAKKNVRFSRMLINRSDAGKAEWVPVEGTASQDDYKPASVQDQIRQAMMCGLAAYNLFRWFFQPIL